MIIIVADAISLLMQEQLLPLSPAPPLVLLLLLFILLLLLLLLLPLLLLLLDNWWTTRPHPLRPPSSPHPHPHPLVLCHGNRRISVFVFYSGCFSFRQQAECTSAWPRICLEDRTCYHTNTFAGRLLRVGTVVETKPAFKLVKTTGQCVKVHKKFRIIIILLVVTSLTDTGNV